MTENVRSQTRRSALIATLSAVSATTSLLGCAHAAPPPAITEAALTGHEHDWDWLVGRWSVKHRRLKERLTGCTEWEEFAGTSVLWLTLGGLGTVDDNVLEIPSGTYRAVGIRAFDANAGHWSIWWLDARNPASIDPPVHGGFANGVGTFLGDDTLRGRPIRVRFRWSKITPTSAHWEQAFSPDGGATWETNWEMDFTRAGAS
jgi:hypothetical protein